MCLSLDLSLFGRAESQSAFIGELVAREPFFLSVYERVEARESLDELKVTELSREYLSLFGELYESQTVSLSLSVSS